MTEDRELTPEQRAVVEAIEKRTRWDAPTTEQAAAFWKASGPPWAAIPDHVQIPPPARSAPSRFSWLLGLLVTAAVTAGLDWAAARWTTTATVPLGFPGGHTIDVQEKRSHLGLWTQKRARPHTGRQEQSQ